MSPRDGIRVKKIVPLFLLLFATGLHGELRATTENQCDESRSAAPIPYKEEMEPLLTPREAAAYLQLSERDFNLLCRRRNAPPFYRMPGGDRRYEACQLDKWRDPVPSLVAELLVSENRPGWIYFLQAEGLGNIKIGYASNLRKRVVDVRTAAPVRLELLGVFPGSYAEEATLHRFFANARLHGEWFEPHPVLLRLIAEITPRYREAWLA